MARPTVMTGWWKALLDHKAGGKIAILAEMCDVTTRTLHRWQNHHMLPGFDKRKVLRQIAATGPGPNLLQHPLTPKYLKRV